jgi:hypothetical protein
MPWDPVDPANRTAIADATNTAPERRTVDYMAEVFGLFRALQHANIPVEWVEEDDLSAAGLKDVKVLYVTEPNVPAERQSGLADWVRQGGMLVTVSGAASKDRYNEPCDTLARATGIAEQPRERMLVADVRKLNVVGKASGKIGEMAAVGVLGRVSPGADATVHAAFEDGSPAIVERPVGSGHAYHFAWMPGMSYLPSATGKADGLEIGFSQPIRDAIVQPVRLAQVRLPVSVDRPMVQGSMLLSDKGAAVTVLNWTGEAQPSVAMAVRVPFAVKSARAVKAGELAVKPIDGGVEVQLPLGAADIVMLRP